LPGQTFDARWSGKDFPGAARSDRTEYELGSFDADFANATVRFGGDWIAPAFTGVLSATVVSLFAFEGIFFYPDSEMKPALELQGRGTATLYPTWSTAFEPTGGWAFDHARYEFIDPNSPGSDPAPVPEPTSIVLTASGLAGLLFRRKRRQ
jgi:hypothetical protein